MAPNLQKSKEIAVHLGKPDFKGMNRWLEKWKKRYCNNIRKVAISGESRGCTVESWKERLPELLEGYIKKEYIYNLDEMECFWRALPDTGFGEKGKKCKGRTSLNTGLQ